MATATLNVRKELKAFHGDDAIKEKYLSRVRAHREADEIEHGFYWEKRDGVFKGCAVGCTLHSGRHEFYEPELGIPFQLAYLQDRLFENLSRPDDVIFPEQFLEAIPVGADLYPVYFGFVKWTITNDEHGLVKLVKYDDAKAALNKVAEYYQMAIDGKDIDKKEFDKFVNDLDRARARALALDLDLALDLALALTLTLTLTLDRARALALDLDLARALALALDLARALPILWRDELLKRLSEAK